MEAVERSPAAERSGSLQALRLQWLTTELARALTPLDVATSTCRHGLASLRAKTAALWSLDHEAATLRLTFAVGTSVDLQERFREVPLPPLQPLPMVDAVSSGEPVWLRSSAELAARYPHLAALGEGGARFGPILAVFPLVVEARVIGGLSFSWSEPRALSEEERLHCSLVAQHCAQAFARARLYEAERQARADAEALRERAAFLASASALLASSVEFQPTLESLAFLAVPRFADWCAIELAPEVARVEPVVAHADPAKVELAHRLRERFPDRDDSPGGVARVLATGKAELYREVPDEMLVAGARDAEHLEVLRELGISSAMMVPLGARGRTLGVITFIAAESGRHYDDADLAVAEDLAHRAALAIDNARLLDEARQAAQARDDFLSIASHELRNPLNALQLVLTGITRSAATHPERVDADWVLRKLSRANAQLSRLVGLVDRLLDVSRLSAGPLVLEPEALDLAALAREVTERHAEHLPAGQLRIDVAGTVIGEWDRLRLDHVLSNLLANAVKYGEGKPIDVQVRDLGEHALVAVRDHGIGIPPELRERIFERFQRGTVGRRFDGFGLGLWIARRAVEASGGTLRVASEPGEGARFEVELPKHPPRRTPSGARERSRERNTGAGPAGE
jgi:signal transduction histidine kinase